MAQDKNKNTIKLAIVMLIYIISAFFIIGDNEWNTGIRFMVTIFFFFTLGIAHGVINNKL